MKRLFSFLLGSGLCSFLIAGGIVTNTNQSASWVRMPAQDASTSISAAYFNPAGLMKLNSGLHFSISNQTIFQNKKVENFYTGPGGNFGLNNPVFEGEVKAPVFPSVYAVYKMDKIAFSIGFNPIGGGGGAVFEKGLPSFEMSPSDLVPSLAGQGVTDYRLNAFFEGTSVFFGYQAGISYEINDMISVFGGVRLVTAKNTYQGHLEDIEVYGFGGGSSWTRADAIMTGIAASATNAANAIDTQIPSLLHGFTFDEAVAYGLPAATAATLKGALASLGLPTNATIAASEGYFRGAAAEYTATATLLGDQSADVVQTGTGITPIIGANISLGDMLNIGIKYEFATEIELVNKTEKDFITGFTQTATPITMFPDGEKLRNDMPSMLSVGARLKLMEKLSINAGTHVYFDKGVYYGKKLDGEYVKNDKVIDKNYFEIAGGVEYNLTENFLVSGGVLVGKTGVSDDYQNDLSYSLNSTTFSGGAAYNVTEKIQVNLGVGYTAYDEGEKTVDHFFKATQQMIPAKETYYKDNLFIGVGVDLSF